MNQILREFTVIYFQEMSFYFHIYHYISLISIIVGKYFIFTQRGVLDLLLGTHFILIYVSDKSANK